MVESLDKLIMVLSSLRAVSSWVGLILAMTSLASLVYVRLIWRFKDFETPHFIAGAAFLLGAVAVVPALAGLPKWKSIIALVALGMVTHLFTFTQLFCCEV